MKNSRVLPAGQRPMMSAAPCKQPALDLFQVGFATVNKQIAAQTATLVVHHTSRDSLPSCLFLTCKCRCLLVSILGRQCCHWNHARNGAHAIVPHGAAEQRNRFLLIVFAWGHQRFVIRSCLLSDCWVFVADDTCVNMQCVHNSCVADSLTG